MSGCVRSRSGGGNVSPILAPSFLPHFRRRYEIAKDRQHPTTSSLRPLTPAMAPQCGLLFTKRLNMLKFISRWSLAPFVAKHRYSIFAKVCIHINRESKGDCAVLSRKRGPQTIAWQSSQTWEDRSFPSPGMSTCRVSIGE